MRKIMRKATGFTLIEMIVAVAIMAIMASAIVPVLFNKLEQARYERIYADLKTIYEATMGIPTEGYYGYVGDMGELPDSVQVLVDGTGQGTYWRGPYVSLGGKVSLTDVYGTSYVLDSIPIRARSYGPDKVNNNGAGDDMVYPDNPLGSIYGWLNVEVQINGRVIRSLTSEQVTASVTYVDGGTLVNPALTHDSPDGSIFYPTDSIPQGIQSLSVTAGKASEDPATTVNQSFEIKPGQLTEVIVQFEDSDYLSFRDTDYNGNGIPDRLEDMDGDGIPDSDDADIDGDGAMNDIDGDPTDPFVGVDTTLTGGGGGGGGTVPYVTQVTPNYGQQGQNGLVLTIDGSNFVQGCTVLFSSTGITIVNDSVTFVGATQVKVTVNIGATASTGYRNVTVTNPDGNDGVLSNAFQVVASGQTPAPSITQLVPSSGTQGASNLQIIVQGQNFVSAPTISFSSPDITIVSGQFINSSEVRTTVNIAASAAAGGVTLTLRNPDNQTATKTFTINAIVPNVTNFTPTAVDQNTNNRTIDITGSNFVSGFTAQASGTVVTVDRTTFNSSSSISIRVDVGISLFGTSSTITITNPGGGQGTFVLQVNGIF